MPCLRVQCDAPRRVGPVSYTHLNVHATLALESHPLGSVDYTDFDSGSVTRIPSIGATKASAIMVLTTSTVSRRSWPYSSMLGMRVTEPLSKSV